MDASLIISIISPFIIGGFILLLKLWIDKRINGKLERIEARTKDTNKEVKEVKTELKKIDNEVKILQRQVSNINSFLNGMIFSREVKIYPKNKQDQIKNKS